MKYLIFFVLMLLSACNSDSALAPGSDYQITSRDPIQVRIKPLSTVYWGTPGTQVDSMSLDSVKVDGYGAYSVGQPVVQSSTELSTANSTIAGYTKIGIGNALTFCSEVSTTFNFIDNTYPGTDGVEFGACSQFWDDARFNGIGVHVYFGAFRDGVRVGSYQAYIYDFNQTSCPIEYEYTIVCQTPGGGD